MKIYIIDNYDSFTYNLVHLIEDIGVDYILSRNDDIDFDELRKASHLLIGPGPGLPEDSGDLLKAIEISNTHNISVLGVCLGMQALLISSGCEMTNLHNVQHGAEEEIEVKNIGILYEGLPQSIKVGRYHSWGFDAKSIGAEWTITSLAKDGFVMSIENQDWRHFGVQFHPESIMTTGGKRIMENWLRAE